MIPATSLVTPNIRTYAGQLLTMAGLPSDLLPGQVLQVDTRTVVTPEVRDHLRRQQVGLQRGVGVGVEIAPSALVAGSPVGETRRALHVWWHGLLDTAGQSATRGSSTRWLGQIDPRVDGQLRAELSSRELADQVVTQMSVAVEQWSGPTQLVLSSRPWEVQRELAERHGTFAWCVMSGGPLGWEQAQSSAASVLVCAPPLTSWIVRRWLTLVKPRLVRGVSDGKPLRPATMRKS